MKGIELSEKYYEAYGAAMLQERFPHLLSKIAVGLAGSGSECFGYDDALSHDHDFEPGFCIFLPDEAEVSRADAFALERAYAHLPSEFMGYTRCAVSPVGGSRHGVIRMAEFLQERTGRPDGCPQGREWFFLPEQALAEVIGGKLFYDGSGRFTDVRRALAYLPPDVRLKKLAGRLWHMGQAGQYNYGRCIARGETAAAQLCMVRFAESAIHAACLINERYMPYDKWSFRALRELPRLAHLAKPLEYLISSGNKAEQAMEKTDMVQLICADVADALRADGLVTATGNNMERHAYAVNDRITDGEIRNLHLLYGV